MKMMVRLSDVSILKQNFGCVEEEKGWEMCLNDCFVNNNNNNNIINT